MTESSFMLEALELAKKGQFTSGKGACVGCIISKNNQIIGKGFYEFFGAPHAEIMAIESVRKNYRNNFNEVLAGSTITVTLEPCSRFGKTPPCLDEILKYNFKKIIIGQLDASQSSLERLKKSDIEVVTEEIPNELNKGFFKNLKYKKPYVRAKIAMSEDKKIAFIEDDNQWITCSASRLDGHKFRALSDIVLTGSGTIKRDNPALDVRDSEITQLKNFQQPIRAIIASESKLNEDLKFFKTPGPKIIFCSNKDVYKNLDSVVDLEVFEIEDSKIKINLLRLLDELSSQDIHDVLLESGPKLITSFIEADLIDEFIIYIAPKILSNTALSFFEGEDSKSPFNSKDFILSEEASIESDKRIIYRRKNGIK